MEGGMAGICTEMCSDDASCDGDKKCCSNGCGHACLQPAVSVPSEKPGDCPSMEGGMAGICTEMCSADASCEGDKKCCSNGCGHACMLPAVHVPSGICTMPKDIGNCEDLKPMYYYETEVHDCIAFHACADGNKNRFTSFAECQATCNMTSACKELIDCDLLRRGTCPLALDGNGCNICACADPCYFRECKMGFEFQCNREPGCSGDSCKMVGECVEIENTFDPCEPNPCDENQKCQPKEVMCVKAPCHPVPQCIDEESDCPLAMCLMFCKHGFELDENGCQLCKCKISACQANTCAPDQACEPTSDTEYICKECRPVRCRMRCEFGWARGEDGCEMCQCNPHPCENYKCDMDKKCELEEDGITPMCTACMPVRCRMRCKFGWARGEDGCEMCQCNPHPCEVVDCAANKRCILADDNTPICIDTLAPGTCRMGTFGTCDETVPMWRYNMDTESCEEYEGCANTRGNNFNTTEDCELKCVGPAVDCSAVMCMMYCEYGFVADENGCAMCKCYQPCDNIDCTPGEECKAISNPDRGSIQTGTYECQETVCAPVRCRMMCQYGWSLDDRGCEFCSCRKPCDEIQCNTKQRCIVADDETPMCIDTLAPGTCRMGTFGTCAETVPMWRYNMDTESCEEYEGCANTKGNNFNTTEDCELKCVGPAVDCSAVMCMMYCEYGFIVDENGCAMCKCYQPCDDVDCADDEKCVVEDDRTTNCVQRCDSSNMEICIRRCSYGYRLDEDGCELCECMDPCQNIDCVEPRVCRATNSTSYICECSRRMCRMNCQYGFVKENGCDICQCVNPCQENSCPESQRCMPISATSFSCQCTGMQLCRMKCEHGYEKDPLGCDTCQCQRHPCDTSSPCGKYEVCLPTTGLGFECQFVCAQPMCANACEHGYKKDEHGCMACECEEPCKGYSCPDDLSCITASQRCDKTYCPKVAVCSDMSCRDIRKGAMTSLYLKPCTPTYVPRCDDDDLYQPMQCNDFVGQCWCVDRGTGTALPGSKTNGIPDCTRLAMPSTVRRTDDKLCQGRTDYQHCSPLLCARQFCDPVDGDIMPMCRVNPCGDKCEIEFFNPKDNSKIECKPPMTPMSNTMTECQKKTADFRNNIISTCQNEQYALLRYWFNHKEIMMKPPPLHMSSDDDEDQQKSADDDNPDIPRGPFAPPPREPFEPPELRGPEPRRPIITTTTTTMIPLPTRAAPILAKPMRQSPIPMCTQTGEYTFKQCHGEVCWCSDADNVPVENSMTIGRLICTESGRDRYKSTGSPLRCVNGVTPYPCLTQCAEATCNHKEKDLTCLADPCANCQVSFTNKKGKPVQCYDTSDCSWISEDSWYFNKANNKCTRKTEEIACAGLVIFERKEECFIHAAREMKTTCPNDPCSGVKCVGNPMADCIVDVNCEPRFIDIVSDSIVQCERVTGVCRRNSVLKMKAYLSGMSLDDPAELPNCDSNQNYAPKQCDSTGKECWCVEKNGDVIPGSRVVLNDYQKLVCNQQHPVGMKAKITLDGDYNKIKQDKNKFIRAFIPQLARRIGIDASRINILGVSEGSIVVEYEIDVEQDQSEATETIAKEDFFSNSVNNNNDFVVDYDGTAMRATKHQYAFEHDTYAPPPTQSPTSTPKKIGPGYVALIAICILLLLGIMIGFITMCRFKEKKDKEERWREYNKWRKNEISKQDLISSSRASTSSGDQSLPEKPPIFDTEMPPPGYDNPAYAYSAELDMNVAKIEQAPIPQDSKA